MVEQVSFQSNRSPEELLDDLSRALINPTFGEKLIASKVRLEGRIGSEQVLLFRGRGGLQWYTKFEGTVRATPGGSELRGGLIDKPPSPLIVAFMVFPLISLVLLAFIFAKQPSFAALARTVPIGLALVGVSAVTKWMTTANVKAERGMLYQEIQEVVCGLSV